MSPFDRNDAVLAQYLDGELQPNQANHIRQHIGECPSCAAEVSVLVSMKRALHAAKCRFSPSAAFRSKIRQQISWTPNGRWNTPLVWTFAELSITPRLFHCLAGNAAPRRHLQRSREPAVVIGTSIGAIASGMGAAITTFCCVGPAVLAVLGTSGLLVAARLEPYRVYFILASVALLGIGFWLVYRPEGGCIGKACTTTNSKITRALLWIAALVTGAAILLPNFVGG